jgi:hypothetical protein
VPLRTPLEKRLGAPLQLRTSLALGVFDFDFDKVVEGDVPSRADTLSFTTGLEWLLAYDENWLVSPYIDIGYGKNFENGEDVFIYSAGISTDKRFGDKLQHQWLTRLYYAGFSALSADQQDGYTTLQSGIDLRTPWRWTMANREFYSSVYFSAQQYLDALEFVVPQGSDLTVHNNVELGFTLGFERPFDFRWFSIERVGFGYRFIGDLKAWRISVNSPL